MGRGNSGRSKGIKDLRPAFLEIPGVAGSDRESLRLCDRGDLTVQHAKRSADLAAPTHDFAIKPSGRFIRHDVSYRQ